MALIPGTRVGPYAIVSPLGAGGMGEVYRARDTKLGRDVALKILPESFARDAERVARFQREAQVLASLNHQHIAQIYGVESDALVMELVDGPTLADRIAQGALPLDEALPIARQITEALEAAHEQGIIHRDLKPANIKVRPDGTVKVLDFGLAKLADAGSGIGDQGSGGGELSLSPTITSPVLVSGAGMILGTAAYMSPEQARGKPVDKRADIWAFGVVLYEMLTAATLFAGETVTDVLASVVRHDPDLARLPASVRPLLRRCLEKDPRRRLRDIGDAMLLLETSEPAAESAPARRRPAWIAWAVAALGLTTSAALGGWIYLQPTDVEPRATRFTLLPPDGWRLTTANNTTSVISSTPGPLAVSPDGRRIAFLANTATGRSRLWVRSLDTLLARELPGTDGASQPFWSPDGQFIAFFAERKLQRIDVTGGPPVILCDSPDSRGGSWGRDGVILFGEGNTSVLMRVASSGGVPVPATTLAAGETGHIRPSFLPDGRQFFYRVQNGGIYASSLDSTERTLIVENPGVSNIAYSQGLLLFMRQSTLMAQPFDPVALTLSGEPIPIASDVQTLGVPGLATFSTSATGLLVYQPGYVAADFTQLTWLDTTGKAVGTVADKAAYNDVLLSPDEKRVAVTIGSDSTEHLWLLDLARGVRSRLTFDTAAERSPLWSPDGTRIVFASRRRGNFDLYQKASDGVGPEEVLLADSVDEFPGSWSPDGQFILYRRADGDLWVLPLAGDRKPYPLMHTPSDESYPQFSPDGRWVAFSSDESGRREVYATPFPGPGRKWQISVDGGSFPRWRNDKEIYFGGSGRFWVAPVSAHDGDLEVGPVRALTLGGTARVVGARNVYDVSRDGRRLIAAIAGDQAAAVEPLVVVENWPALLRK